MQNRRSLLKNFLSLPLLFGFQQQSQALPVQKKTVLINRFSIAGFQYYDGQSCLKEIKQNDVLLLSEEPDNQYDKYAVEVSFQSKKLGYVPRTDNKHISRILQSGGKLTVKVDEIDSEKYAWDAVRVLVYMEV
ncbi:HIRAN domain-containing protein [sulfur-oxidizing endosymbiont of Gigantopelta aegis]|uniref:HIRAN domain-containing protein n=1 Tax=sulfur-oxidizing endosymbiont of Gigantopelta aegis TaxID=2794934 RepID=UPI0018DB4E63|nr:HIRAN domain-containing protein [sulfur-oxidizing endosymbiont of Gigantopelta aegis]